MNAAFWRGRRVFVTGHTGFKGAWLCVWLQSLGAEVVGYALAPPTRPNLFEAARVGEGMASVVGDVRDLERLTSEMARFRPELVLHLAAQPLVRQSYDEPVATFEINVMGTVHVLESVRRVGGVRGVVNVTTDKCYENREWLWGYRENEPLGGHDPYSGSKACSELATAAYRSSFFSADRFASHGVAVASARAGNVLGGGDWAKDRLVPDCIRALLGGEPLLIRNPGALRPWQHVLEPLSGYLELAERLHAGGPAFAEAWNFGPRDEDARAVGWVVERLLERAESKVPLRFADDEQPHEAQRLRLDWTKARARLGWSPRLTLDEALDWTLRWFRSHAAGEDMKAVTLRQIESFAGRQQAA